MDVIGETSVVITSKAQTINWKGYGLKVHIPQGALPVGLEECRLLIKVLSGQFAFPENTSLVSAVYCLDSDPKQDFSKHLAVEIQHCASNTTRLSFVWAKCSQKHLPYKFEAVEKGEFSRENTYGCVHLNHFSLWALVRDWWSGNQLYCAHLYYIEREINLRHIHYVIIENLEVNITVSYKSFCFYMLVMLSPAAYFYSMSIRSTRPVVLQPMAVMKECRLSLSQVVSHWNCLLMKLP